VESHICPSWKTHGIAWFARANWMAIPADSGMTRAAAITQARAGAEKLWAGTVVVAPSARTGAHHHGELETVLYIVKGRARIPLGRASGIFRRGRPGDFIFRAAWVPHQESERGDDEPVEGRWWPQRAGAGGGESRYREPTRFRCRFIRVRTRRGDAVLPGSRRATRRICECARGGGTFVIFPALLFAGVASVKANATASLVVVPGGIAIAWVYRRTLVASLWVWFCSCWPSASRDRSWAVCCF